MKFKGSLTRVFEVGLGDERCVGALIEGDVIAPATGTHCPFGAGLSYVALGKPFVRIEGDREVRVRPTLGVSREPEVWAGSTLAEASRWLTEQKARLIRDGWTERELQTVARMH